MLDLFEELLAVHRALTSRGIEYALCGGLAMAVHSLPRATVDIDILIRGEDEQSVYDAVEPLGFLVRATPMHFGPIEIRRVSKIDPEAGDTLMLDLLLVTADTEDVWASRQRVALEDVELPVVSRAGLIKLKSFRLSGTDRDDIARLRGEEQ